MAKIPCGWCHYWYYQGIASVAKILEAMRRNPQGVTFADAVKVATEYFGAPRNHGGSHKVFKTPWPGDPRVNLQEGNGGKAKTYQVKQLLQAIERKLSVG